MAIKITTLKKFNEKEIFNFVRAVHQMFPFGKHFGNQHKESLKSPLLYNIWKCYIGRNNMKKHLLLKLEERYQLSKNKGQVKEIMLY